MDGILAAMDSPRQCDDLVALVLRELNTASRLAVLEDAPRTQHAVALASFLIRHLHGEADTLCPLASEVRAARACAELAEIRLGSGTDLRIVNEDTAPAIVPRGRIVRAVAELLETGQDGDLAAGEGTRELTITFTADDSNARAVIQEAGERRAVSLGFDR